jgi:predicted DNA-binding transcriptional regulator AlpA
MDEPLTSSQVAVLLGLTRQGVHYLVMNDPTFPAPVANLPTGRVWERADILRWGREKGRITDGTP